MVQRRREANSPDFFSWRNLLTLSTLIFFFLAARWSVISHYNVRSASMEPSLKVGDRVMVYNFAYDWRLPFTDLVIYQNTSIKRGEIVVFRSPNDPSVLFVKRVVAVGGDKIKIEADRTLYINGQKQDLRETSPSQKMISELTEDPDQKEFFLEKLDSVEHLVIFNKKKPVDISEHWPQNAEDYLVPKDAIFVMGDNRDNSLDSRIWGKVPLQYVLGRVKMVLWSAFEDQAGVWHGRWARFFQTLEN